MGPEGLIFRKQHANGCTVFDFSTTALDTEKTRCRHRIYRCKVRTFGRHRSGLVKKSNTFLGVGIIVQGPKAPNMAAYFVSSYSQTPVLTDFRLCDPVRIQFPSTITVIENKKASGGSRSVTFSNSKSFSTIIWPDTVGVATVRNCVL